jgi:hypothetical protein
VLCFRRSLSNDGGFAFGAKEEDEEREVDRDGYGEELAYLVKRVKVDDECSMEELYTMPYIS